MTTKPETIIKAPIELRPGDRFLNEDGSVAYTVLSEPTEQGAGVSAMVEWADGAREPRFWMPFVKIPVKGGA